MSLRGFCKTNVVTVTPDHLVTEAAQIMRDYHVGDVVVVQDEAGKPVPVGFLTDRDITIGLVANAPDRLMDVSVEEIMTKKPICAREEEGLYDVMRKMRKYGVSRMPVIDAQGTLVGILTAKNLIALLNDELSEIVEIGDKPREAAQDAQIKGGQPASRLSQATQEHMQ